MIEFLAFSNKIPYVRHDNVSATRTVQLCDSFWLVSTVYNMHRIYQKKQRYPSQYLMWQTCHVVFRSSSMLCFTSIVYIHVKYTTELRLQCVALQVDDSCVEKHLDERRPRGAELIDELEVKRCQSSDVLNT